MAATLAAKQTRKGQDVIKRPRTPPPLPGGLMAYRADRHRGPTPINKLADHHEAPERFIPRETTMTADVSQGRDVCSSALRDRITARSLSSITVCENALPLTGVNSAANFRPASMYYRSLARSASRAAPYPCG